MKKRMFIMLLVMGIIAAGLIGFNIFKGKMVQKIMAGMANPVQTVSSIKAVNEDWQPKLESVGTMRAVKGADLSVETSGIIETVHFESDSDVKSGELLLQLRSQDEIGKLRSLEADAKLAEITLERDKKQLEIQAVSQATVDSDQASLDSLKAQIEAQRAAVDKKSIKAPFAGRAGIRQLNVGQYVTAGTSVVTLQQLDPIYVDFYLPEQDIKNLKTKEKILLKTEAYPDVTFYGEVNAINPKVDTDTRNVLVEATLKNPERLLMPGMFANVTLEVGKPKQYLTVPETAITFNPYGNTVFVVEETKDDSKKSADAAPKLTVRQTFVTIGPSRGNQVAILSGVKEGETVVTSGQLKLRNGSIVKINNEIQPANTPDPTPHEE